jgi:hypothetical protein
MTASTRRRLLWLLPALTFGATLALIVLMGRASGVGAAVYLPLAISFAVVLAGIPIAYLIAGDDTDDDELIPPSRS